MSTASNAVTTTVVPIVAGLEFLTFTLGQEEYGVDIQKVQELRGYETVTRIANAPEFIKGVVNLRGIIVPIIDMRIKFNLGTPVYDQFTVVVILNMGRHIVGMVVDSVSDLITLTPDQVKPAPEMGATPNTDYLIGSGTIKQRMLILVDIDKLMSSTEMGLIEKVAAQHPIHQQAIENAVTTTVVPIIAGLEFLAFTLGQEEYGVDIQKVQELRGYERVTRIANAPEFIKGVVNLRGIIVPIIDMRIKFDLGTPSYDQFTVIIILNMGSHVVGMVVDSVSDLITLTPDQVKPAPEMGATPNTDYLIGSGTIKQRMLILVDIDKLMSSTEMGLIEKVATQHPIHQQAIEAMLNGMPKEAVKRGAVEKTVPLHAISREILQQLYMAMA